MLGVLAAPNCISAVLADTTDRNRAKRDRRKRFIRHVQRSLTKKGYDPGPADGTMGKKMTKAIAKFQRKNGIKPTGTLTPATVDTLFNSN